MEKFFLQTFVCYIIKGLLNLKKKKLFFRLNMENLKTKEPEAFNFFFGKGIVEIINFSALETFYSFLSKSVLDSAQKLYCNEVYNCKIQQTFRKPLRGIK